MKRPSDFDLLVIMIDNMKQFSYNGIQRKVSEIQKNEKLFQTYFANSTDIQGAVNPESLELSFHIKVLRQLEYIKRNNDLEYITTEKCRKEAEEIRKTYCSQIPKF